MKKIIILLLPLNIFIDILSVTVFEIHSTMAISRAVLYYSFLFYTLIKAKKLNSLNWYLLLYFLYIIIQIPFSTYPLESLRISLKVLLSILMFPIGYILIYNYERLALLNRSIIVSMAIFIINFIVSQYFNIGFSEYTGGDEFLVGSLSDSWNVVTYILMVVPLILMTEKNRKLLVLIMSFILIILLIIGLKRTAILGLGIGYLIYFIISGKSFKLIITTSLFFAFFYLTLPIYGSILSERLYVRQDRIQGQIEGIISEEMRYIETIEVFEETVSFQNPKKVIFGMEAFNSVGNYGGGAHGDRNLHIDYNLILNTTGIVGLLLYFNIFRLIYKKKRKLKIHNTKNAMYRALNSVFYMLIITQFFTSFGGQMYAITFRSIIFIYLGAILRILENFSYDREFY